MTSVGFSNFGHTKEKEVPYGGDSDEFEDSGDEEYDMEEEDMQIQVNNKISSPINSKKGTTIDQKPLLVDVTYDLQGSLNSIENKAFKFHDVQTPLLGEEISIDSKVNEFDPSKTIHKIKSIHVIGYQNDFPCTFTVGIKGLSNPSAASNHITASGSKGSFVLPAATSSTNMVPKKVYEAKEFEIPDGIFTDVSNLSVSELERTSSLNKQDYFSSTHPIVNFIKKTNIASKAVPIKVEKDIHYSYEPSVVDLVKKKLTSMIESANAVDNIYKIEYPISIAHANTHNKPAVSSQNKLKSFIENQSQNPNESYVRISKEIRSHIGNKAFNNTELRKAAFEEEHCSSITVRYTYFNA